MSKLLTGLLITLTVFTASLSLAPTRVNAVKSDACHNSFLAFPTWYEYLDVGQKGDDQCAIIGPKDPATNEFSFSKALPRIALAIVDILLRVAGAVAVVYVIFGGFKYMTSQGEAESTKSAQNTVVNALIGLAIAVLATAIVSFLGSKLWT